MSLLLVLSQAALAQGFDAHALQLAAYDGNLRDPLTVQRPSSFHQGDWFVGGVFEYESNALMTLRDDGLLAPALDDVVVANLSGGGAVHDRVRLDLSLPVVFASKGEDGESQGAALGDMRATAMIVALPTDDDGNGVGVGVIPYLDLPTGAERKLLGNPGVSGGTAVAATYGTGPFAATGSLGLEFTPKVHERNITGADTTIIGLAVGYVPTDGFGLDLEWKRKMPFKPNIEKGAGSPTEIILTGRWHDDSGPGAIVGASMGMGRGVGAPAYRIFVGGGFGKAGPYDMDLDGIVDKLDTCPAQPETVNLYNDTDGCPDTLGSVVIMVMDGGQPAKGAVVEIAGPKPMTQTYADPIALLDLMPGTDLSAKATLGSCLVGEGATKAVEGPLTLTVDVKPVENAAVAVTVLDPTDKPVNNVRVTWDKDDSGCTPSGFDLASGEGRQAIGAGKHRIFVTAPNYSTVVQDVEVAPGGEAVVKVQLKPTKVRVELAKITILDKVYFETGKAVIKPESYGLLDEVAAVIASHPNIKKIEIGGHTDSQGNDAANLDLSKRRASSVRDYIISKGVVADRLVSQGYGETKPIATNKTSAGRAENRRVEFNIVDQETAPPTP